MRLMYAEVKKCQAPSTTSTATTKIGLFSPKVLLATATVQFDFHTLFHISFLLESVAENGDSGCLTRASAQRHCPSPCQMAWTELLKYHFPSQEGQVRKPQLYCSGQRLCFLLTSTSTKSCRSLYVPLRNNG